ncbi:MAG: hypothetical protein ABEK00_03420 [Candidatus Nanohaloarchaea archaeon]
MLGYWLTRDLETFFSIKGTDKIILTFIVGTFSVFLASLITGIPETIGLNNAREFLLPTLGITVANSIAVALLRETNRDMR